MGLDAVEIIMEVEETFGIKIPDEDYQSLTTAGCLSDYVVKQLPSADADAVWNQVQALVSESLMIPLDQIKPSSRWGEDLGVD